MSDTAGSLDATHLVLPMKSEEAKLKKVVLVNAVVYVAVWRYAMICFGV